MSANTLFEIKNLSFAYQKDIVLRDINFSFCEGDFWAMIGPNGGGKTTLVKIILGLLKARSGAVDFRVDRARIGYVPQITNYNMDFPIRVREVVAMGALKPKIFGHKLNLQSNIMQILEYLNLSHLANAPLFSLSGGERQKVLIARALINQPKLLILDEPTSNIDVSAQEGIYKMLCQLNTQGLSILAISHDIALLLGCANKVLYVNEEAHTHDMPYMSAIEGHICEAEILAHFAKNTLQSSNASSFSHTSQQSSQTMRDSQHSQTLLADSQNLARENRAQSTKEQRK